MLRKLKDKMFHICFKKVLKNQHVILLKYERLYSY